MTIYSIYQNIFFFTRQTDIFHSNDKYGPVKG